MKKLISAIIVAGGSGTRTGLNIPKQFYMLGGKTILEYAVAPFAASPYIDEIIIVTLADYTEFCKERLKYISKPLKVTVGGETRQKSVYNGLALVDNCCSLVIVHDGARPFVTEADISGVIDSVEGCAAVIGKKVHETIKFADAHGFVENTPERERLWSVQTPQAIPYSIFADAYKKAEESGFLATDDVSLAELIGYPVKIVRGSENNIKITSKTDLELARMLMGL